MVFVAETQSYLNGCGLNFSPIAKDSLSNVVSIGAAPGTESGSVRSGGEPGSSDQSAASTSVATSSASALAKWTYPPPAEVPTHQGARGIQFDFNDGCRVALPESSHPWRVRLSDLDTGNILYETELKAVQS